MARYSFSEAIPAKFEHKLVRRHKQTFGKIATTVVLDKGWFSLATESGVGVLIRKVELMI